MRTLAAIAILLSSVSSLAHAESDNTAPDLVGMRSAQAREQHLYGLGGVGGLYMGAPFAGGVEVFGQANQKLAIGLTYTGGTIRQRDDGDRDANFETKVTSALVQARWFTGNSFYFKVAGGMRFTETVAQDNVVYGNWQLADADNIVHARSSSALLGVGIGNLWTFDSGFYIGGEWVGAYVPVWSSTSQSIERTGKDAGHTASLVKRTEDYNAKSAAEGQLHAAVLTIGSMI